MAKICGTGVGCVERNGSHGTRLEKGEDHGPQRVESGFRDHDEAGYACLEDKSRAEQRCSSL